MTTIQIHSMVHTCLEAEGAPCARWRTTTQGKRDKLQSSALEQYRARPLLNLSGGSPTTYQVTTGNAAGFAGASGKSISGAQDTLKLTQHLILDAGFRYQLQTSPGTFAKLQSKAGTCVVTRPRRRTWAFSRPAAGLFTRAVDPSGHNQCLSPGWDLANNRSRYIRLVIALP